MTRPINKIVPDEGSNGRRYVPANPDLNLDIEVSLTDGAFWAYIECGIVVDMDAQIDKLMERNFLTF